MYVHAQDCHLIRNFLEGAEAVFVLYEDQKSYWLTQENMTLVVQNFANTTDPELTHSNCAVPHDQQFFYLMLFALNVLIGLSIMFQLHGKLSQKPVDHQQPPNYL